MSDEKRIVTGYPCSGCTGRGECDPVCRHRRTDRIKASNPKDAVGTGKVPFSTVPAPVIAEVGLGMLEGARKYGRHNYRAIGVRGSVYYDAAMRHLTGWWEGQDIDPDSGLSHITKALASLVVLRDAMMNGKWIDDRPPPVAAQDWIAGMNKKAAEIIARYPDAKEPYTKENCAPYDDGVWPCHKRPQAEWCDRDGPGGFMGHTCALRS